MKRYKSTPQVPTTYFTMIQDVYYKNQKIYLLVATNNNRYFCNTICILDISETIKHTGTFKLTGNVYESFCITENSNLIAFNSKEASIDVFTLPPLDEDAMPSGGMNNSFTQRKLKPVFVSKTNIIKSY
jgi:hypothetical protein